MSSLLLIIALLLALVVLLLALPITVSFRIDRIEEVKGQVRFQWPFGIVQYRIVLPGDTKAKPRQKQKPEKKSGKRKEGSHVRNAFGLLKQSAFRCHVLKFIKDLLGAAHARDLFLRLRIGLDDPADTGRLWAFFGPIAGMTANLQFADIRIEPEFMDPLLEVESYGRFRIIPLQFLALAALFLVSPTTLQAWRILHRGNM